MFDDVLLAQSAVDRFKNAAYVSARPPAPQQGELAKANEKLQETADTHAGRDELAAPPKQPPVRRPPPPELRRIDNPIAVPAPERACPRCGKERTCIGHDSHRAHSGRDRRAHRSPREARVQRVRERGRLRAHRRQGRGGRAYGSRRAD
jgi:hypothetical protein